LVRMLCQDCKIARKVTDIEQAALHRVGLLQPQETCFEAHGCAVCNGIGYNGRTVVSEILNVDHEIRELVAAGASAAALQLKALQSGMRTLISHGASKSVSGVTSLQEVIRSTHE
jgi:type II secretory ATPase GspE/PulE/Tfp pilus assembly ATPase PilB-like protein